MVEGLAQDRHYVLYSDTAFMVFIVEDKQVIVVDGGILYNDTWSFIDLETVNVVMTDPATTTSPIKDEFDSAWIVGSLESEERFWLTYTIVNGSVYTTGVFVYDGETLQEDYTVMNLSRLFY